MTIVWILLLLTVCYAEEIEIKSFQLHVDDGILKSVASTNEEPALNLSSLELKGIEVGAFDKVAHLTSLNLSLNRFYDLSESVFSKLTNLEQLSLSSNKNPINVNRLFSNLSKLKVLDLSGQWSGFTFSSDAFVGLPDDTEIKVTDGLFSLVPTMFSVNDSLQIGYQNLTSANCSLIIPEKGKFSDLKKIFEHNKTTLMCITDGMIEEVGSENANCLSLPFATHFLYLNNRGIKSFKKNWYRLSKTNEILELYLEGNKISEIDENLLNDLPSTLSTVILRRNYIKILKNNTLNNKFIKNLDLYHNNIRIIESDAFRHLTALVYLDLSYNEANDLHFVSSLPSSIQRLKLTRCNVTDIPEGIFSHLSDLRLLDLSWNKIEYIKKGTFSGLSQLNNLILNKNAIARIEKGPYDHLPCMQVLSFSHNRINFIEKGFARKMNNIRSLYIDYSVDIAKLEKGLLYGLPLNATVRGPAFRLESIQPGVFKNYETTN